MKYQSDEVLSTVWLERHNSAKKSTTEAELGKLLIHWTFLSVVLGHVFS